MEFKLQLALTIDAMVASKLKLELHAPTPDP